MGTVINSPFHLTYLPTHQRKDLAKTYQALLAFVELNYSNTAKKQADHRRNLTLPQISLVTVCHQERFPFKSLRKLQALHIAY